MVSRFSEICIDCDDPWAVATFWAGVLGWRTEVEDDDDEVALIDPEGVGPDLLFVPVPENKTIKNRLHIDVSPRDRDQASEVERLLDLGATHADVGQGPDVTWVVLADPEGNEFCVLREQKP